MKKVLNVFVGLVLGIGLFALPTVAEAIGGGGQMSDDEIMDAVQRVDGAASQLDADFLDAISSAGFCQVTGDGNCTLTGQLRIDEDTTCTDPQIAGEARTQTGIAIVNSSSNMLLCRGGELIAEVGNDFAFSKNVIFSSDDNLSVGALAGNRPRRVVSRWYNSTPIEYALGSPTSTVAPGAGVITVVADAATAWTPSITGASDGAKDGDLLMGCTTDAVDTITVTEGASYKGTCVLTANTQSCFSAILLSSVWNQVSCSVN